jgi:hypothetical protein
MSALHTLLAVDGTPDVLEYLADLGLQLAGDFRSRWPTLDEVRAAVARREGWSLGAPDSSSGRRFWCELSRGGELTCSLLFTERENERVLAGTRGDPCLPLLRELAREVGPLVVLLNAEEPLLVGARS